MLHVHENVKDTDEAQWLDYLVSALSKLSPGLGNGSLVVFFCLFIMPCCES